MSIKKGKVLEVTPNGSWSEFNKYIVKIENNDFEVGDFNFLAKGEFKKKVGESIEFEIKNNQYRTAKIYYNANNY